MGEYAETTPETRPRVESGGNNYHEDTIKHIDNLVPTNEVVLEGFGTVDKELHPHVSPKGPSNGNSHDATSYRTKKRARKIVEDYISMRHLVKSIEKMVDVFDNLSKSITEWIKQNKNVTAKGVIWVQLEQIGVEPNLLPDVYLYLVEHANALRASNGIPLHRRKEMLARIVTNYQLVLLRRS